MEAAAATLAAAAAGAACGSLFTWLWMRGRRHPVPPAPLRDEAVNADDAMAGVLEASRAIVEELETRYRGRRAVGDSEDRPRRRKPRQRPA